MLEAKSETFYPSNKNVIRIYQLSTTVWKFSIVTEKLQSVNNFSIYNSTIYGCFTLFSLDGFWNVFKKKKNTYNYNVNVFWNLKVLRSNEELNLKYYSSRINSINDTPELPLCILTGDLFNMLH